MAVPMLPRASGGGIVSDPEAAAPDDWFYKTEGVDITAQTLHQQNGFATTLLRVVVVDDEDADGFDDAYERFSRFAHRPGE